MKTQTLILTVVTIFGILTSISFTVIQVSANPVKTEIATHRIEYKNLKEDVEEIKVLVKEIHKNTKKN